LLRRIDILALRKKDVNFKDGEITIIQKKTNRSVFIPMTNKLKAAFDSVKVRPLQDDGLWFPDIVPINLTQAVIRRFKKAGIDYGSFHHFRHFGACYLLNNGIPIEVVSKILGHKSIQTTQIYARVKRQTVKEAMAVFDAK
jgi:integrase